MRLSRFYSSIFLIIYILITLGLRFWIEANINIGIIPSIVLGVLFLAIPYWMYRKDIINPYRNLTDK